MKPNGFGMASTLATAALLLASGCARHDAGAPTVLATRDFVADPGTMPTEVKTSAAPAPPTLPSTGPILGAASPSWLRQPGSSSSPGADLDVVAIAGAPEAAGDAPPQGSAVLIDEQVGEINGRPIRAREIFDDVGARLAAAARTRRLTNREWEAMNGRFDPRAESRELTRDKWLEYARRVCAGAVNSLLEDELLEAEARASLKPEQKQGLAYFIREAQADLRRREGGSLAAAERKLQESGKSEQQYLRKHEATLLINYQLQERIRKKVRVTWKDVRLYYERHFDEFNPPPSARFRLIRVAATSAGDIAAVQEALDAAKPFPEVAAMKENTYQRDQNGFFVEKTFAGEYAAAAFNFTRSLEDAAHTLEPGAFTKQPVDVGRDKAWLFLESITRKSRPLSDRDVQLEIARRLTFDAENAERQSYIEHLKQRASFTDLDTMVRALVQAAAERYWPGK